MLLLLIMQITNLLKVAAPHGSEMVVAPYTHHDLPIPKKNTILLLHLRIHIAGFFV